MDDESDFSGEYEPCPLCGDMVEQGFECRRVKAWRKQEKSLSDMNKDKNYGKGQGQQEAQAETTGSGSATSPGEEASGSCTQAEEPLTLAPLQISPALQDLLEFERYLAEAFRCEMAEYVTRINRAMAESEQAQMKRQFLWPPDHTIFMK